MKISIIVPVYNSEEYIDKLIKSIIKQTYQNYEIILVDDGSQDNSLEKIKSWAKKDSRIKAYSKKNTGPGLTRKFGYEKSSGDLFFFVDSDDWITHDSVLEKIIEIFKNKIDILFFDREEFTGDDREILNGFNEISPGEHNLNELIELVRPGLGCKVFKKELLEGNMFVESNVYEDLYTTYLYLNRCKNFYYLNEVLYTIYHKVNSNTLSSIEGRERNEKSIFLLLDVYKKIQNDVIKHNVTLYMAKSFTVFCRDYIMGKKYTKNKNLKKSVKEIKKILIENNTIINPKSNRRIKIIMYKIMLRIF